MSTKSIAWNTGSGNITLTYQGQGDGPISVVSDANNGSARSQTITIQTTKGGLITKNVTVSQAACPFPVGDVRDFSYTGSYQEVELPAGQYKLQCWGAQGGSNGTNSSYGITAQAGGKGGYSEGIITLSQKTTVRVYVGGQGTSSAGGFNGGGSTTGTSQYNASNEFGYSKMGGGGGATDIRLSDGALLSRMIVAGGGSGGAMCYRSKTTTTTEWVEVTSFTPNLTRSYNSSSNFTIFYVNDYRSVTGEILKFTWTGETPTWKYHIDFYKGSSSSGLGGKDITPNTEFSGPSNTMDHYSMCWLFNGNVASMTTGTFTLYKKVSSSITTTDIDGHEGYVGGGEMAGSWDTGWPGTQTAAGTGGSFGQGANQTTTNYRYCSAGGGGGWYGGGGGQKSDSSMTYCKYAGGGSGWVNIYANRGNRPSGYTGLQLDSGTTYRGNQSFPKTSGSGNETGHAGNGYARITRIS